MLEGREACSKNFYHAVIYGIIMHFRYESFMGGFLTSLAAGYRQYVGIITLFSYVG